MRPRAVTPRPPTAILRRLLAPPVQQRSLPHPQDHGLPVREGGLETEGGVDLYVNSAWGRLCSCVADAFMMPSVRHSANTPQ